jgi:ubiquinone/menaquinone biosynthesis C-methylase UbiE
MVRSLSVLLLKPLLLPLIFSAQCQSFPAYPARNASEELLELKLVTPSHLHEIVHYVYGGDSSRLRTNIERPYQVLVVGAGTGDATIMLAVQLLEAAVPFHIHHLEPSAEANEVALLRAKVRSVHPFITFVQATLDQVTLASASFKFDYIDCGMVLQQLPSPIKALAHMYTLLADDGGIGLSVTATHNRAYADLGRLLWLLHASQAPKVGGDEKKSKAQQTRGQSPNYDFSDENGTDFLRDTLLSLPTRHPFRELWPEVRLRLLFLPLLLLLLLPLLLPLLPLCHAPSLLPACGSLLYREGKLCAGRPSTAHIHRGTTGYSAVPARQALVHSR